MKMLNNVLEAGVFEISRIPIQCRRSTKKAEGDPLCAAPLLEPPVQVHPHTTTPRTWPWPSGWTDWRKDIKGKGRRPFCYSEKNITNLGKQQRQRRNQRGGILPVFLIPAAIAAPKATAAGAISGTAGTAQRSHRSSHAQETSGKNQCGAMGSQ